MVRGLAVLIVLAAPRAYAETCIVSGASVTLDELTIQPAGDEAFQLGIRQVPVFAQLPARCGDPVVLQVGGAVAFTATRNHVWFRLARDVTSSDGLIVAKRGAQVIDACVRGDRVIANAVTFSDDVHEGENKSAGEIVTGFDIPCSALTLDAISADDDADPSDGSEHDRYWELRGQASRVALRARPRRGAAAHVLASPSCQGCILLRHLERRRDWVLVEAAGEDVRVRGWVPIARLRPVPADTLVGRGYMCSGNHGVGGWGELPVPNAIEREGTIRAGTRIYTGPASGQWGAFVSATRVKVRYKTGDSWAELRRVPGLDGDPSGSPWLNAQVPLDTVTFDPP